MFMDNSRNKSAIVEKLMRCRALTKEFASEPSATHLREIEAELLAELRKLESGDFVSLERPIERT
jgi:hypothetical protein